MSLSHGRCHEGSVHDALHPQRPLGSSESFPPKPRVGSFNNLHGIWRALTLAPNPKDADMSQVDPPPTVKCVQTFDDIIGLTGTGNLSSTTTEASPLPACDERSHRPIPSLLRVSERLGPKPWRRREGGCLDRPASGNAGHKGVSNPESGGWAPRIETNQEHKPQVADYCKQLVSPSFLEPLPAGFES
jgi:hypothetical protein